MKISLFKIGIDDFFDQDKPFNFIKKIKTIESNSIESAKFDGFDFRLGQILKNKDGFKFYYPKDHFSFAALCGFTKYVIAQEPV